MTKIANPQIKKSKNDFYNPFKWIFYQFLSHINFFYLNDDIKIEIKFSWIKFSCLNRSVYYFDNLIFFLNRFPRKELIFRYKFIFFLNFFMNKWVFSIELKMNYAFQLVRIKVLRFSEKIFNLLRLRHVNIFQSLDFSCFDGQSKWRFYFQRWSSWVFLEIKRLMISVRWNLRIK